MRFALDDGRDWWFTGVYGPQLDANKLLFLQELRDVHAACLGPWLVGRDFNPIYRSVDKKNPNIDRAMIGRFRWMIDNTVLQEIELLGRHFTWSNDQESLTLVRLYRVLCSSDWDQLFLDSVLQSTAASVSDRCPLILGLRSNTRHHGRFHFMSFWPSLQRFQETGGQLLSASVASACSAERLVEKFKALSRALQAWSQRSVGNVKSQLHLARELPYQLDRQACLVREDDS